MDWPEEMESPQQAPEGVSMTPLEEEATIVPNEELD
jgi:hypothetical protein